MVKEITTPKRRQMSIGVEGLGKPRIVKRCPPLNKYTPKGDGTPEKETGGVSLCAPGAHPVHFDRGWGVKPAIRG